MLWMMDDNMMTEVLPQTVVQKLIEDPSCDEHDKLRVDYRPTLTMTHPSSSRTHSPWEGWPWRKLCWPNAVRMEKEMHVLSKCNASGWNDNLLRDCVVINHQSDISVQMFSASGTYKANLAISMCFLYESLSHLDVQKVQLIPRMFVLRACVWQAKYSRVESADRKPFNVRTYFFWQKEFSLRLQLTGFHWYPPV